MNWIVVVFMIWCIICLFCMRMYIKSLKLTLFKMMYKYFVMCDIWSNIKSFYGTDYKRIGMDVYLIDLLKSFENEAKIKSFNKWAYDIDSRLKNKYLKWLNKGKW